MCFHRHSLWIDPAAMMVLSSFLVLTAWLLPAIVCRSSYEDGWAAGWKHGWSIGWNYAQPYISGNPYGFRGTQDPRRSAAYENGRSNGELAGYWAGREAGEEYFGVGQPYTGGFPYAGLANLGFPYPPLMPITSHLVSSHKTKGLTVNKAA